MASRPESALGVAARMPAWTPPGAIRPIADVKLHPRVFPTPPTPRCLPDRALRRSRPAPPARPRRQAADSAQGDYRPPVGHTAGCSVVIEAEVSDTVRLTCARDDVRQRRLKLRRRLLARRKHRAARMRRPA